MLFKKTCCMKLNLLLIISYQSFLMNLIRIDYNIYLIISSKLSECCA